MRKIDFFIAGVQKAGSTTLYNLLSKCNDIYMPKEIHLPIARKNGFDKEDLKMRYKNYTSQKIIGGGDVNCIYFSHTARILKEYNNDIKIIIVLRNPVDRAYSAFNYFYRLGIEKEKYFKTAIEDEDNLKSFDDQSNKTYLSHGYYYNQLLEYYKFFKKDQIHIILFKDLVQNQEAVLKRTLNFLGLSEHKNLMEMKKVESNPSAILRSTNLHKLTNEDNFLKKYYQKIVPKNWRFYLNVNIMKRIERLNKKKTPYPPMDQNLRNELACLFNPYNDKLSDLIDINLDHWEL